MVLEVVRDMAPMVRPWKPPSKAMTLVRPVAARATLTALSTASEPLLQKKNCVRCGGMTPPASRSTSSASGDEAWKMFCCACTIWPAWRRTASTTCSARRGVRAGAGARRLAPGAGGGWRAAAARRQPAAARRRTFGWQWPVEVTPMPEVRSSSLRPSAV
jgi:hypothetical protein